MKLYKILRFKGLTSHLISQLRCASTEVICEPSSRNLNLMEEEHGLNKSKPLKVIFNEHKPYSICAIMIAVGSVNWAHISIPDFSLLNWNSYLLPEDFRKLKETKLLNLVYEFYTNIPKADFYLMEGRTKFKFCQTEAHMKTMLMMLLSFDQGEFIENKIIIQAPGVLNQTHKLLIGSSRRSAIPIVTNAFISKTPSKELDCAVPDWYLQLELSYLLKYHFTLSDKLKKEGLSLTLLLALSYLNKKYFPQQKEKIKLKLDLKNLK